MYKYLTIIILIIFGFDNVASAQELPTDRELLHKIDQMIMIGFRGTTLRSAPELRTILETTNVGGVILFDYDTPTQRYRRNIFSPAQTKQLITDSQNAASTPLFIGIDEEGGKVNRLKQRYGFRNYLASATTMARWSNTWLNMRIARHGEYLRELGFNVNFAPVVDVAINPTNPAIVRHNRSFGTTAQAVIQKARVIIATYADKNILTTIKHYPGHGSSSTDSHTQFVDISKTHQASEYEPYSQLCASGANGVMIGHLYDSNVDTTYPASLSRTHIDNLKAIGCSTQLIVSDDYDMNAIRDNYTLSEITANAINSGVDVLIFSNNIRSYDPDLFYEVRSAILQGIREGTINPQRIDSAYTKIMNYKKQFGVWESR